MMSMVMKLWMMSDRHFWHSSFSGLWVVSSSLSFFHLCVDAKFKLGQHDISYSSLCILGSTLRWHADWWHWAKLPGASQSTISHVFHCLLVIVFKFDIFHSGQRGWYNDNLSYPWFSILMLDIHKYAMASPVSSFIMDCRTLRLMMSVVMNRHSC